jgi:hypothetical protein
MNFPTLPFDSLYKFMFIGGILFIIGSFYLQVQEINNVSHKKFLIDSLSNVIISDSLKTESIKNVLSKMKKADSLNLELNEELLGKFNNESFAYLGDRNIDLNKHQAALRIEYLKDSSFPYYWLGFGIGFFLFIYGGLLWFKQQVIQDSILQRQLDLLNLEVENKNKYEVIPKVVRYRTNRR